MSIQTFGLLVLASLSTVSAWLPNQQRSIYSRDGTNLFEVNATKTKRWLPEASSGPIRGVNLGSMFVFEPWIASAEWSDIGCGPYQSEFDCVSALGQEAGNAAFQYHWADWIVQADIQQMASYGLNTIRIPVGYWMDESLPFAGNEWFPQGGISYLEQVCEWAAEEGFYIIIDLHGAPGAQVADNPDTGQYASTPGFYVAWEYTRALNFLTYMTNLIHTTTAFRNVGMLSIVNEPVQDESTVLTMLQSYYPDAFSTIRAAETALGITSNNYLNVQMMNALWGSGDPTQSLTADDQTYAAYDDHRYLKYDSSVAVDQEAYLTNSCTDSRGGNTPTIVGEFSLSVPDDVQWTDAWTPVGSANTKFYTDWFAAQIMTYEKQLGWIFWTWKSQLGDYRWSYQDAVAAGVIPTDLDTLYDLDACSQVFSKQRKFKAM